MTSASEIQEKALLLAELELKWWIAHHRRDIKELIASMTELYCSLFNLSIEDSRKAIIHRVRATQWHNKAEKYEDAGEQQKADIYWDKTKKCLVTHFTILETCRKAA